MRWSTVFFTLVSCSASNQFRSNAERKNVDTREPPAAAYSENSEGRDEGVKPQPPLNNGNVPPKGETSNTPSGPSNMAESEQVLPPSPINGSYLHCVVQLEPSDLLPEGNVACRLEDSAQNRVDPAAFNALALYSVTPFVQDGFTASLTTLTNPDRTYDVTIAFAGRTRLETARAMRASQLQLEVRNLETSQLIGSQKSSIGLVETKTQPLKWQTIAAPTQDIYLDTATGYHWTGDDQNLYTVQEAVTYCNELETGNLVSWLLPSLAQLTTARNHGIGSRPIVSLDAMTLKSGGKYWTANRYIDPTSNATQVFTIELVNNFLSSISSPTPEFEDNKMSAICITGP